MKNQIIFAGFLLFVVSNLTAMTAGQKLIRMVIGDYAKASQQKPQVPDVLKDYDYELVVEQNIGVAYPSFQMVPPPHMHSVQIQEKCRNGLVAGKVLAINTSRSINPLEPDMNEFSEKSYYGAMDSELLRERIASAGTCSTADKVCSPAGMCICTNFTTRIRHESLEKK